MKRIQTITLGADQYTIRFNARLIRELTAKMVATGAFKAEDGEPEAICCHLAKEIVLQPKLKKDPPSAWKALLHEIIHVVELHQGEALPEPMVERLAQGLYSCLVQSGLFDPGGFTLG